MNFLRMEGLLHRKTNFSSATSSVQKGRMPRGSRFFSETR